MQNISLVSSGPTGAEGTAVASPLCPSADESSSVERQKWEKVFEGQVEEGAHNLSTCGFWEEGGTDGSEKWEAVKDTCALKVAIRVEGGPWVFERCDILSDQGIPIMLDDAEDDAENDAAAGTQFTCFTRTKVQILSDQGISMMLDDVKDDAEDDAAAGTQITCFTSTKEQILTQMIRKSATYRNPPT
jgi:hypothetical protein